MAAKKLAVSVTVRDPDTGEATVYQAGDTVPAADAELITNPDVWDSGGSEEEGPVPGDAQFSVTSDDEVADRVAPPGEDKPAAKRSAPTPASQASKSTS